jgi:MFS family permease
LAQVEVLEYTPLATDQEAARKRGRFYLALTVAMVGFALSLQVGLNPNFVAQTMAITGEQQGMLEGSRESCGIIALGVLALLTGMSEPRIGVFMLVLMSAGLSAYSAVPSFGWLVMASFIWSQGFHVWVPLPGSMAMALGDRGKEGKAMGTLGAAGAIGSASAIALALGLHLLGLTVRPMFLLAGAAGLAAAFFCSRIPKDIKAPGARLIIRKKYWLYYVLQFLEGWRKQIFIAFAGFMLVREYGTPLWLMLVLALITQTLGWFVAPLTGRIIDKLGEKKVLLFYYATMAIVCGCYARIQHAYVLYGLYVADSVLFSCNMALTTYVGRLAPREEHTATLSAGVAANHVAAVMMPLVGGVLWKLYGYQWAFYMGAVMAVVTLVPVMMLPRAGKPGRE